MVVFALPSDIESCIAKITQMTTMPLKSIYFKSIRLRIYSGFFHLGCLSFLEISRTGSDGLLEYIHFQLWENKLSKSLYP